MASPRQTATARSLALLTAVAIVSPLFSAAATSAAWPPNGEALAERGKAGMPSCASCHGAHFQGDAAHGVPALAGKDAADMMDWLYAMATSPKNRSPMADIARKLDMAERAAVTAWLSRLPAEKP